MAGVEGLSGVGEEGDDPDGSDKPDLCSVGVQHHPDLLRRGGSGVRQFRDPLAAVEHNEAVAGPGQRVGVVLPRDHARPARRLGVAGDALPVRAGSISRGRSRAAERAVDPRRGRSRRARRRRLGRLGDRPVATGRRPTGWGGGGDRRRWRGGRWWRRRDCCRSRNRWDRCASGRRGSGRSRRLGCPGGGRGRRNLTRRPRTVARGEEHAGSDAHRDHGDYRGDDPGPRLPPPTSDSTMDGEQRVVLVDRSNESAQRSSEPAIERIVSTLRDLRQRHPPTRPTRLPGLPGPG